jgi:hypothetical protein
MYFALKYFISFEKFSSTTPFTCQPFFPVVLPLVPWYRAKKIF